MKFILNIGTQRTVWEDPDKMESYIRMRLGLWFNQHDKKHGTAGTDEERAEAADSCINLLKQGANVSICGHDMGVEYDFDPAPVHPPNSL